MTHTMVHIPEKMISNNKFEVSLSRTSWADLMTQCFEDNIVFTTRDEIPYDDVADVLKRLIKDCKDGKYRVKECMSDTIRKDGDINNVVLKKKLSMRKRLFLYLNK